MTFASDRDKWSALVAAEQEVARCRAEVGRLPSLVDLLTKGISGKSAWDRTTALEFLRLFPENVPNLLGLLINLSMSHGWAQPANEALRAARREIDSANLAATVTTHLSDGDGEDFLRLAEMLIQVEEWETLGILIGQASESSDPEMREAASDFSASREQNTPDGM